jgi:hypothetical protein
MVEVDALTEIATVVWASMLERDLVPGEPGPAELSVACQVHIQGAWDGRVTVAMSAALAHELTAKLFMLGEDEVSDELVADAVGELANIIGGNVKALFPPPNTLGLPGPPSDDPGELVAGVSLRDNDEPVLVTVEQLAPMNARTTTGRTT